jgi:hypothetical protein
VTTTALTSTRRELEANAVERRMFDQRAREMNRVLER